MATWLTHLRAAEAVSELVRIGDKTLYYAGSVAPDSGLPPDVTHWCTGGDKSSCDADGFWEKYITGEPYSPQRDFFLGYYVHLLTDRLWHAQKIDPILGCSKEYIKSVKEGWKSSDAAFITAHPDYMPAVCLSDTRRIGSLRMEIYPPGMLAELAENFASLYKSITEKSGASNPGAPDDTDEFIKMAAERISCDLIIRLPS